MSLVGVPGPITLALKKNAQIGVSQNRKPSVVGLLVAAESKKHNVDPTIIASIIWQESTNNWHACEFEEEFYDNHLRSKKREDLAGHVPFPIPTLITEKIDRAHSWGKMQVLGETGRVMGFKGQFFTELAEDAVNIPIGVAYFARCVERAEKEAVEGTIPAKVADLCLFQRALVHYNGAREYALIITSHLNARLYEKVLYE